MKNKTEFSFFDFDGMTVSELVKTMQQFPANAKIEVKTETVRTSMIGESSPEERIFIEVSW